MKSEVRTVAEELQLQSKPWIRVDYKLF